MRSIWRRATRTRSSARTTSRNNIIHHWERLCLTYQAGIAIDGVGNTIENNLLYSAPHHGIEPNGNDQLVTGNVLHHFSEDVFDNGGLYWAPDDWTDWNYTIVNNGAET